MGKMLRVESALLSASLPFGHVVAKEVRQAKEEMMALFPGVSFSSSRNRLRKRISKAVELKKEASNIQYSSHMLPLKYCSEAASMEVWHFLAQSNPSGNLMTGLPLSHGLPLLAASSVLMCIGKKG